jgi:probable FeS assembly SUF system protein SufT
MVHERMMLTRDVKVTEIPSGYSAILPAGTHVTITQTLGGSYTVMTNYGLMARIERADSDAIGKDPSAPLPARTAAQTGEPADEKVVWDALRTIYDPEIPVNIVDLGLVYLCELKPLPEGGRAVYIQMTMTAPGCGMGSVLQADVEARLGALPGIKQVDVELVWDPPWDRDRMSEAARLALGML